LDWPVRGHRDTDMAFDGDSLVEFGVDVGSPRNLSGMNSLLIGDGSHAHVDTSGSFVKVGSRAMK